MKKANPKSENESEISSYKAALGTRIKKAAERIGGGADLSRITGIPRSTLEYYFTGKTEPKVSQITDISLKTGVSIEWLATGEGTPEQFCSDFSASDANEKTAGHSAETIETAASALYAWLEKKRKVMNAEEFGKAVAVLCDMKPQNGKIDMQFVDRLMSFKGML